MKKNIIFIIFFQILFPLNNHSNDKVLRKKLQDDSYFCREQGAMSDIFGIKNDDRIKLLDMIDDSPVEDDICSQHFGEKTLAFFASITTNGQNQQLFHLKNTDSQSTEYSKKNKDTHEIIKTATTKLSYLTGEPSLAIDFRFFKDFRKNKKRLFWHQDIWGSKTDPKYLAFAILARSPDGPCTHTIPMAQELGLVDNKLVSTYYAAANNVDFIDKNPLKDSPDYKGVTSKDVSLLSRHEDKTDSGYLIDQSKIINGKSIVHCRTERMECPCCHFDHRTSLVARIRPLKNLTCLPYGFLNTYISDGQAKQLCTDYLKEVDTSVLEKLADDQSCRELGGVDIDKGSKKYLALIKRDEENAFRYVFKEDINPLQYNLSAFTTASILVRFLRNDNGEIIGKKEYKWDKTKKSFDEAS